MGLVWVRLVECELLLFELAWVLGLGESMFPWFPKRISCWQSHKRPTLQMFSTVLSCLVGPHPGSQTYEGLLHPVSRVSLIMYSVWKLSCTIFYF